MRESNLNSSQSLKVITSYDGPLCNLCQAGFDEQVKRVSRGENPSITEGTTFSEEELTKEHLLRGLTPEQVEFVQNKIPNL